MTISTNAGHRPCIVVDHISETYQGRILLWRTLSFLMSNNHMKSLFTILRHFPRRSVFQYIIHLIPDHTAERNICTTLFFYIHHLRYLFKQTLIKLVGLYIIDFLEVYLDGKRGIVVIMNIYFSHINIVFLSELSLILCYSLECIQGRLKNFSPKLSLTLWTMDRISTCCCWNLLC